MNRTAPFTLFLLMLAPGALAQEADASSVDDPLRITGYIQARYVWTPESTHQRVTDGFTVRRARLKPVYTLEWSQYLLELDANPRGLSMKQAEVHLIEPWTGHRLRLVAGQTKWPFGYEVDQSSSRREFPERSQVVRAFAAGERDRGVKVVGDLGVLEFSGGVFEGNGIENRPFLGVDNDRYKDVVGRIGFDAGFVSGGASGWYGRTLRPADVEEGVLTAEVFPRTRVGADLQITLPLLPVGATLLRAEAIWGRTYFRSRVEQFGLPALGWYAVLVQNLGEKNQVALRHDYFDPLLGTRDGPSSTLATSLWGVALMHQWNRSVELTAALELPVTLEPVDPSDTLLTLQAQAKF